MIKLENHSSNRILRSTIAVIIGLSLLIVSGILALCNIYFFLVMPFQVIGNIVFGVGLIGYFLHVKERKLLKWTSLVIGIMYVFNLFTINALLIYLIDNYDIFNIVHQTYYYYLYLVVVGAILIFYGISFFFLGEVHKSIKILTIIYTVIISLRLISNILYIIASQYIDLTFARTEELAPYLDLISYGLLLSIYVILFNAQRNRMGKTLKVK